MTEQLTEQEVERVKSIVDPLGTRDANTGSEAYIVGHLWLTYRLHVGDEHALSTAHMVLRSHVTIARAVINAIDGQRAHRGQNKLRITITEATPSNNELLNWHWRTRNNHKHRMIKLVKESLMRQGLDVPRPPKGAFVFIRATRYGARSCDYDNLCAGMKYALDALKHHGLIVDDSTEHVMVTYHQEKAKKEKRRTEFELAWREVA